MNRDPNPCCPPPPSRAHLFTLLRSIRCHVSKFGHNLSPERPYILNIINFYYRPTIFHRIWHELLQCPAALLMEMIQVMIFASGSNKISVLWTTTILHPPWNTLYCFCWVIDSFSHRNQHQPMNDSKGWCRSYDAITFALMIYYHSNTCVNDWTHRDFPSSTDYCFS